MCSHARVTWTNAAACPGASVSALRPLEVTLHAAATRILFHSELYPTAPLSSASLTPQLSESQVLILTVLQATSWLVPRPSPSHLLLPVTQPSQPQPLLSWLLLKHSDTFLEASVQNLLITEHFPDLCQPPLSPSVSLFTTLIITWHRIFPNFIVCSPSLLCVYYFPMFCL